MNRIPKGVGVGGAEGCLGFIRALKFSLRTRYQNCAQAHSLAQEPLQLFKFSSSVDIPSKVAEVLAFMENLPQGPIRTEPKPKSHKRTCGLQAVGFLLFIIHTAYEDFGMPDNFHKNLIVEDRNGGLCSAYE